MPYHSGHGLHVYLLIERVFFESDGQKTKAKQTWQRLAYLLRSMDRFDLSSMMRLPGTVNRKNGGMQRVHFITEHTDLNRQRYTLDQIAEALKDLPVETPEKKRSKKVSISRVQQGQSEVVLDPWEQQIIDSVEKTDKYFKSLRADAKAGKRKGFNDRSKIEFEYACMMLELEWVRGATEAGGDLRRPAPGRVVLERRRAPAPPRRLRVARARRTRRRSSWESAE